MAKILIIDDDRQLCKVLSRKVMGMGHETTTSFTIADGLRETAAKPYDVVFLDVRMPDGNGLDILPDIRRALSQPEVIIMTGKGDPNGAELAIKSGAWDYIEKPTSISVMVLPLMRALQYREAKQAVMPPMTIKREGIIGESALIRDCLEQVGNAAASNVNVLITGETGTGKELFAWAIHNNSSRASRNFVVVDCASLSDNLVGSTLFGYEKGAFTGADQAREGLVLQADGGTLFLDEVGELPLSMQKTLLRVLQEHRFRPLGKKKEVQSDFRLIAATNQDLDQMVRDGQFRSDLLFRLRSFTIELPPLRKRPEDVREIAIQYLKKLNERNKAKPQTLSPEFLDAIAVYDWPGNVRELINTLERVYAVASRENTIFTYHLPIPIRVKIAQASISKDRMDSSAGSMPSQGNFPKIKALRKEAIMKVEREYLENLLSISEDNIKKACDLSGLCRARLYELMRKHNVSWSTKTTTASSRDASDDVGSHMEDISAPELDDGDDGGFSDDDDL